LLIEEGTFPPRVVAALSADATRFKLPLARMFQLNQYPVGLFLERNDLVAENDFRAAFGPSNNKPESSLRANVT
jgi:hypothetical protein